MSDSPKENSGEQSTPGRAAQSAGPQDAIVSQPAPRSNAGIKAILAAMLANLGIALLKFLAWALSGAASMLAEAVHSVADTANQIIMLLGDKQALKKADAEHQFGHGHTRFINAFLVALILFSMGGLFAVYEAINKFQELAAGHPNELLTSSWWWVAILVLVGSMIMEGSSLHVALKESKPHRQGLRLWQFIHRSKEPEFMVVILEDTAALIGLSLAFIGIVLSLFTGNGVYDVIGSGLIGLLLIAVAIILAIETRSLLIGEAADPDVMALIQQAVSGVSLVQRVAYVKTMYLGPDELLVAMKIIVPEQVGAEELAKVIDTIEAKIRANVQIARLIYIEPDTEQTITWEPPQ